MLTDKAYLAAAAMDQWCLLKYLEAKRNGPLKRTRRELTILRGVILSSGWLAVASAAQFCCGKSAFRRPCSRWKATKPAYELFS